jgi:hypothetical protein
MPQTMQLVLGVAAIAALVVCGCIMTRKPRKKSPTEARAVPVEHEPGCFALEEERGGNWKGSGGSVPTIKETRPSL